VDRFKEALLTVIAFTILAAAAASLVWQVIRIFEGPR
jgi:hypothetical protein